MCRQPASGGYPEPDPDFVLDGPLAVRSGLPVRPVAVRDAEPSNLNAVTAGLTSRPSISSPGI